MNKPISVAKIPATNCKGIMSTFGYFLTIKIKIANDIGIINATKIKISKGEISNNARIFCCLRERLKLFFKGVPSADNRMLLGELLTIKGP